MPSAIGLPSLLLATFCLWLPAGPYRPADVVRRLGPAASARAQAFDTADAREALRLYERTCALPASRVFGGPLCGPLILIDPATRAAISNRPDPEGAFRRIADGYVGIAPEAVPVANTTFRWRDQRWTVVMLPLPRTAFSRVALLMHEATHRLQDSLNWKGPTPPNTHLDEELGRLWWRVELRAWQHALTTTGRARRVHARAALAFRAERGRVFPGSAEREDAQEYVEGAAEYLGQRVAQAVTSMGVLSSIDAMRAVEARPSYVRSAAYGTGPAIGLLLDAFDPRWYQTIRRVRSMARLLSDAVGMDGPPLSSDSLRMLAAAYGYARIAREEADRASAQRERRRALLSALVDGPTLTLRGIRNVVFDPNSLVALDSLGTVYPRATFTSEWGTLTIIDGDALVSPDGAVLRVSARPASDRPLAEGGTGTLRGPGWTLVLASGWRVTAGVRPGDWVLSIDRPD